MEASNNNIRRAGSRSQARAVEQPPEEPLVRLWDEKKRPAAPPRATRPLSSRIVVVVKPGELPWLARLINWILSFFNGKDRIESLNAAALEAGLALDESDHWLGNKASLARLDELPTIDQDRLVAIENRLDAAYQQLTTELDHVSSSRTNIANKGLIALEQQLLDRKLVVQALREPVETPMIGDPKAVLTFYLRGIAAAYYHRAHNQPLDASKLAELRDMSRGDALYRHLRREGATHGEASRQITTVRRFLQGNREFICASAKFESEFSTLFEAAIGCQGEFYRVENAKLTQIADPGERSVRQRALIQRMLAFTQAEGGGVYFAKLVDHYLYRTPEKRLLEEMRVHMTVVGSAYTGVLQEEFYKTESSILELFVARREYVLEVKQAGFDQQLVREQTEARKQLDRRNRALEKLKVTRSKMQEERALSQTKTQELQESGRGFAEAITRHDQMVKSYNTSIGRLNHRIDTGHTAIKNLELRLNAGPLSIKRKERIRQEFTHALCRRMIDLYLKQSDARYLGYLHRLLPTKAARQQLRLISRVITNPSVRAGHLHALIGAFNDGEKGKHHEFFEFYRELYRMQATNSLSPLRLLIEYGRQFGSIYDGPRSWAWSGQKQAMDALFVPMLNAELRRDGGGDLVDAWKVYAAGAVGGGFTVAKAFYAKLVEQDATTVAGASGQRVSDVTELISQGNRPFLTTIIDERTGYALPAAVSAMRLAKPLSMLRDYVARFGRAFHGQKNAVWSQEKKITEDLFIPMFTESLRRYEGQDLSDAFKLYAAANKGIGYATASAFYNKIVEMDQGTLAQAAKHSLTVRSVTELLSRANRSLLTQMIPADYAT